MKPCSRFTLLLLVLAPVLLALTCLALPDFGRGAAPPPLCPTVMLPSLVQQVKKAHPRLLVEEAKFESLQRLVKQNPAAAELYAVIREEAGRLLTEAPCSYEPSGENGMLAASRGVLHRVYTLALVYRVEGGSRYLQRLREELETAAAFPDWHPGHFLDTAEMTHAFAIAYDWLFSAWTEPQRQVLVQAIVDKGLKPALSAYQDPAQNGWWSVSASNWNLVANCGIGLGALAVLAEAPDVAAPALDHACRSLPLALAAFQPDGGCCEGPLYWGYGSFYTCLFGAALESSLGSDLGLAKTPGLAETGLFPLYLTGPAGLAFNFADSDEKIPWLSQLFWLARKFGQPAMSRPALDSPRPRVLALLWRNFAVSPAMAGQLPLDKYFRGVEVAVMRSSWRDDRGTFAALKAGDNRSGHAHLDLGTFVLDALGQRWAVDLGPDDYNLPGYFEDSRWDYYRLRAEGHNALVINPGGAPDQDPAASARISRFHSSPDWSFAITDLTPAYARQAHRVWRGLALVNRRQVLVEDEIDTGTPAEVWWFLHTPAAVQLSPDRRHALLTLNGQSLAVRLVSPDNAVFELRQARPLPLSPHPLRQSDNAGIRKLAIKLSQVRKVRLAVWFDPLPVAGCTPETIPAITPLADWH